jgi:type I restriction enzyme S subunit
MADQTIRKAPRIRFKGFVDHWQELSAGQVTRDYVEKTVVQNQYPVLTSSQQHGIVRQTDYFASRQVTTDRNIGYLVLPKGFFSYRSRSDNDSFVFNRNDVVEKGIISYYYPVFEVVGCDSEFFLRRINFGLQRQLRIAAEGTGQRVLAHSSFKRLTASYPELSEQSKIGAYFRGLDRLIALNGRKHEKLTALKAAMLDKMFPKPGATAPVLRFRKFSEPWVEKKLKDVGNFNPKEVLPDCFEYVDLESVVGTEMVGHRKERRTTAPSRAQRLARKGDLFFQNVRPYQRNNHLFDLPDENYVFSTGYTQIRPHADGRFLLSLMQRDDFVRLVLANCTGTSYPAINSSALSEISVLIPTADEQKVIGAYFFNLNALISRHAAQVRKLQQIKLACLDEMFV